MVQVFNEKELQAALCAPAAEPEIIEIEVMGSFSVSAQITIDGSAAIRGVKSCGTARPSSSLSSAEASVKKPVLSRAPGFSGILFVIKEGKVSFQNLTIDGGSAACASDKAPVFLLSGGSLSLEQSIVVQSAAVPSTVSQSTVSQSTVSQSTVSQSVAVQGADSQNPRPAKSGPAASLLLQHLMCDKGAETIAAEKENLQLQKTSSHASKTTLQPSPLIRALRLHGQNPDAIGNRWRAESQDIAELPGIAENTSAASPLCAADSLSGDTDSLNGDTDSPSSSGAVSAASTPYADIFPSAATFIKGHKVLFSAGNSCAFPPVRHMPRAILADTGDSPVIPSQVPEKRGFIFTGWRVESLETPWTENLLQPGDRIENLSENLNLTAVWKAAD